MCESEETYFCFIQLPFFSFCFVSYVMTSFTELRQRLFHPYYIVHFIYGVIYVIMRSSQLWKTHSIDLQVNERKRKRNQISKKTNE